MKERSSELIETGRQVHGAIKETYRRQPGVEVQWFSPQVTVIALGGTSFSVTVRELPPRIRRGGGSETATDH